MSWVEILPRYESSFRHRGWSAASSFLAWNGVLVNRHRQRQVACVTVDSDETFYLKTETAVSWRVRLRNAWQGFGWCSTAVREAQLLQALRTAGIGCPEVAAFGEKGRQAFVLLRAATGMTELRLFLQALDSEQERRQVAVLLGHELARLHAAGFNHPDLFAKHILVARHGAGLRFCLLDWQRSRRRPSLAWKLRCRDWATLDATLHTALASDRLRLRCLRAYLQVLPRQGQLALGRLALGFMARSIRRAALALWCKRNLRDNAQMPVPDAQQQLVPLQEGRLLVVRAFYEELDGHVPDWLARMGEVDPCAARVDCCSGRMSMRTSAFVDRTPAHARAWELPALAHTLFRLHRFGVPAPRLLAVRRSSSSLLVLWTAAAAIPLEQAFEAATVLERATLIEQVGFLVRQVHEAGYRLADPQAWPRCLGVCPASGEVVLVDVDLLMNSTLRWQQLARLEWPVQAWLAQAWPGTQAQRGRLLRSYLRPHVGNKARRPKMPALASIPLQTWERQVSS